LIAGFTFPQMIFSSGQTNNIHLHQKPNSQSSRQERKMELGFVFKKAPYEAKENTFLLQETIIKITFLPSNICTRNYN
jgi:hypothetical protein